MAGNIKGITIEFRGDTTKLDKALRTINSETRKIDKELRQVDKALKFNPTSVDLWRQKQTLLANKISETKEKLTLLKNEQARMDANGVDKNSEEYRRLQRDIIETESKLKHFKGEYTKVGNVNFRAAGESLQQLGGKLEAAGQKMKGLSMAAAAVTAAIGATVVKSGKWADDLNTMSKVYSIGTTDLQKYAAAADLVDVSVDTIAATHRKLTKAMAGSEDETGAQAAAFERLGVATRDSNGELRDTDDVWNDVIVALGKVENETERDALAMQLMGKSASELNPLIEDGGKTYKKVAKTLKKYGLDFISEEELKQANEFNDELDTIKMIGLTTFRALGTKLAGYLAPALKKAVDWVGKLAEWFSKLSPRTLTIVAAIGGLVAVLAPLLIGIGKVCTSVGAIIKLIGIVGPAIGGLTTGSLLPIIAVIAAVVAAGVLLYKNWDKIKAKAIELGKKIKEVFDSIKKAVVDKVTALKTWLANAWESIKKGAAIAWNAIKSVIFSPISGTVSLVYHTVRALVTWLPKAWASIKTAAANAWNSIKSTASNVWNSIKNAIISPIQTAWEKVKAVIAKIKSIFPLKLGKIFSGIKLPHFKISGGKIPWGIGGKGTAPKINVEWYKKGGIFDSPSVIGVGEAGSEAVVPLDTLWKKLDNIAEASAGGAIVVNVYGSDNMSVNELAAAVEQRLIQMQKRRTMAWQ